METKDYELFLIAVPQHTQQQEDFYDFMNNKAGNCMAGAMYFENITKEEISEIMANIVKKGVEASGIQTE
jgi:hypothetical protein